MSDELRIRREDGLGRITLNRPNAINALTHRMVTGIRSALDDWRQDAEVSVVVLDGAGDRGLCAGGDVVSLRQHVLDDRHDLAESFWRDEYELCATIAEYPKPFVALMDGVTMGGGVGISAHASIRIVTEMSRVAMPETRIGFSPDVGATLLLSRAPDELGTYLGLNAATMTGADAVACGFADYYVPSENLEQLIWALAERADPGTPAEVVLLFDETPPPSELLAHRGWIVACYSADTVPEIIERLRREGSRGNERAQAAADELGALSPTALAATLSSIRRARDLPLRDALANELRISTWLASRPDFAEGIRAQLVDKDRQPRWAVEERMSATG